jgi:hypothetical protein
VRAASGVLTALGAALVIAGCGGHTATKKDVIARGNAICSEAIRSVRSVLPPAGAAGLAAYMKSVLPVVEKEVSDTKELPRPSQDHAILDRYVAAVTAVGAQYHALATAAQSHDAGGVSQALAALRTSPAAALAKRYGLSQCGTTSGTVQ